MKSILSTGLMLGSMTFGSTVASATIVLETGNNPQIDENILFEGDGTDRTGNPVIGRGNQSSFLFAFDSTSTTLDAPAGGQARVEGGFTNISFFMLDPAFGFTSAIFNLNAASDGDATISVDFASPGGTGTSTEIFTLDGNGNNFFTITSIDQQVISKITIDSVEIDDIRQVRIGGAQELPDSNTPAVPEPATLSLLGGGLGAIVYFKRKQK